MKIGPHSDAPVALTPGVKPSGAVSAASGAHNATSGHAPGVAVSVSKDARALGTPSSSAYSEVDSARVEAFRTAIAQGTFVVNPGAIADKLLSNAQEMLDRVKH